MEEITKKKIYESGKLHGIYRCKKREDLLQKIPQIEKKETPDITGIIIAGIMNFGNDPETIRMMAKECLDCNPEAIKIPYDEIHIARSKFIKEIIIGKLRGSIIFSVESLVKTFYEFVETPTTATKNLQAAVDIRNINRYLNCENRTPIVIGQPIVHLRNFDFICQNDFIFAGKQTIKINKRKEGRRYVYDEVEMDVVESVRLFPGTPQVKESSKVMDMGTLSRLELYVMLKAMEEWCNKNHRTENVMLRASYYYLQKDRENDKNYNENFFEKGGNVVSLQIMLKNISKADAFFESQLNEFIAGMSVTAEKCQKCTLKTMCDYHESAIPLTDEEKPKPQALPVLSEAQARAANILKGNVRVIATAGSGKTTTMAYRIMNLLKNGVAPEKIGCFTFTNAGATEMSDRIKNFCAIAGVNADVDKIVISTIHSFGDSLLKRYYDILEYRKPPVLINEIQRTKIIEKILSDNPPIEELIDKYKNFYMDMFKTKGILETMKDYFGEIMDGMEPLNFKNVHELKNDASVEAIYKMYKEYDDYKKKACLIEHSDQELGVLKLLAIKPDLFDEVGLEHISIDEYQDTSNVQFEIIDAMRQAKNVKSVFIVGDDDQSIYGFRDANVTLIKDFFNMIHDDGYDIQLMENRRSTGCVVDFASNLIANNDERIEKHPVSTKEHGKPVDVVAFGDKDEEYEHIAESIDTLIKNGHKANEIAVLMPTNTEILNFAEKLEGRNITSVSINPEPILDNPRVKGAIGLVKFILSNNEFEGVNYINVRDNGETINKSNEEIKNDVLILQKDIENIKTVSDLFERFNELDQHEYDEIYQSFLEDIRTAQDEAIAQNRLNEIYEYIIDFERFGKKQTARKEKSYNGVVLSTMHSSKGKEWPIVFCSVSKLHPRTLQAADIPEKNRLLFVACTRAKAELHITGVDIAFKSASAGDIENMFLAECKNAEESSCDDKYIAS